MQKESKNELDKMLLMMNRLDNHYTTEQVEILKEGLERSGAATIEGTAYNLSTPEELIKVLSKEDMSPKKSWYVTLGYVKKFDKLGDKKIASSIEKFGDEEIQNAKSLNNDRLNKIIDNPVLNKKGFITNPYITDSYTNYIAQVDIIRLMYGRNEEYGKQKLGVKDDLTKYQQENPEKVQHYLDSKGMLDFTSQSYDDARATSKTKIPNTNAYQYDNGSYELNFNTPKTVFKKLLTKYFLITDENTIEEITKEEAEAYAKLYGVVPTKRANNDDEVVQEVDKAIKDIKAQRHGGDIWTNYNLDSVFLLNFTTEDTHEKLQYYNPNAVVEFVKGRELKSGNVPSRRTTPGVFAKHFDSLKK